MLALMPAKTAVAVEYPDAGTVGPLMRSPFPLVMTNPPKNWSGKDVAQFLQEFKDYSGCLQIPIAMNAGGTIIPRKSGVRTVGIAKQTTVYP